MPNSEVYGLKRGQWESRSKLVSKHGVCGLSISKGLLRACTGGRGNVYVLARDFQFVKQPSDDTKEPCEIVQK